MSDTAVTTAPEAQQTVGSEGVTGTVEMTTPEPLVTVPKEVAALIPEAYKERPWVKEIKSVEQVFKMLDDQKSALGRRPAGIPQDNASDADWAGFNKAFGVPEKPEDYSFDIEGKEFTDTDKKFHEALRPVLQQAGISKRQLAKLAPGFDKVVSTLATEMGQQKELAGQMKDQEFDRLADQVFGKEKDAALASGKALLAKYAPPEVQKHLDTLDAGSLVLLAGAIRGIAKDFIAEDKIPNAAAPGTESAASRSAQGEKLMASDAYKDPFHPDHERVRDEVNKLFGN